VFPLDPPSVGDYSPGGHAYEATDIFASIGTRFVAVTSGTIQGVSRSDTWDPDVNDGATRGGLFVSLIGDDGVRYYGSHLSTVADGVEAGVRVEAGRLLGLVGVSGSARDTPPHLHFGISRPTDLSDWEIRRGEIDPVPLLDAWRAGDTAATPTLPAPTP
jgi:murein DD-endopeptidase MepM/ murein hydrolase activator NlpD